MFLNVFKFSEISGIGTLLLSLTEILHITFHKKNSEFFQSLIKMVGNLQQEIYHIINLSIFIINAMYRYN